MTHYRRYDQMVIILTVFGGLVASMAGRPEHGFLGMLVTYWGQRLVKGGPDA